MEEQTTQQILQERFQKLPPVIQSAITDSDWQKTLRRIVEQNNLLIDQGLAIETETFLMMLGVENPKDFTKNIKKEANLDNKTAIKIAQEVDDKILKEVKRRIIEASEEESGHEINDLDEVMGYREELEEKIPSIDTGLPSENQGGEINRQDLIGELQQDIEINDNEAVEEEEMLPADLTRPDQLEIDRAPKPEASAPANLPTDNLPTDTNENVEESQEELPPHKIPLTGNEKINTRAINAEALKKQDDLPPLQPLRTLQSDTEKNQGSEHDKITIKKENRDSGGVEEPVFKPQSGPAPTQEEAPGSEMVAGDNMTGSTPAPEPQIPEPKPAPTQTPPPEPEIPVAKPISEPEVPAVDPISAPETNQTQPTDLTPPEEIKPEQPEDQQKQQTQSPDSDPYREPIE